MARLLQSSLNLKFTNEMIAVDENLAYGAFLLESKQNELNKPRTTETGRRGATSSPPM